MPIDFSAASSTGADIARHDMQRATAHVQIVPPNHVYCSSLAGGLDAFHIKSLHPPLRAYIHRNTAARARLAGLSRCHAEGTMMQSNGFRPSPLSGCGVCIPQASRSRSNEQRFRRQRKTLFSRIPAVAKTKTGTAALLHGNSTLWLETRARTLRQTDKGTAYRNVQKGRTRCKHETGRIRGVAVSKRGPP